MGSVLISTILILPIHEHGVFLHLLKSSLITFTSVLLFSIHRSSVSLGRYILKYFILFVAMVNGIFPVISLYIFSLLMYRNARDFCFLILYPATLLFHWLALIIFWWSFYDFLRRGSCHLQTVKFYFFFSNLDSFLLFLSLLWLLWPNLPEWCWKVVVKVGTLVLFLTWL